METIYQQIINIMVEVLPQYWQKFNLYAQITPNSYEIFFFVKIGENYINCFNLDKEYGISRKQVRVVSRSIYDILLSDQTEKKWFCMTTIIANDGSFHVDYDYQNHSENTFAYKEAWKAKYLTD